MGITKDLAEFVCQTKYDDFSSDVVSAAKNQCLIALFAAVAGSRLNSGKAVINYVRECGAPPEAGVLGAGFRTSTEYAALVNGTTYHATELEGNSQPEGMYLPPVVFPPFALGEKLRLPGKKVLEGFILGFEVEARLGLACMNAGHRGWVATVSTGSIGVAAGAAKLLKLGVNETTMALSLAASQAAAGLVRQIGTGAHLYEAGIGGRNGISAAMLAKHGLTGQPDILEGRGGLCDALGGEPEIDLQLGKDFRIKHTDYKKYPCCSQQQRIIDGVIYLIKEHNISYNNVESIEVDVSPDFLAIMKYVEPNNEDNARFCLPHSIAATLLDDEVFLDSYTDEKVRDPIFKEARQKVRMIKRIEWTGTPEHLGLNRVTIKLKDGTEHKKDCINAKGDVSNPLNDGEIKTLGMDCALRVLPRDKAEQAAKMVLALDEVRDVSELMSLLTFPAKQ